MKIGVSSYSFSKYIEQKRNAGEKCDYLDICDKAKEIGFDGIEFIDLNWKDMTDDNEKTAREIRNHCEKIGLEIIAYTVGANFLADDIQSEIARIKKCVDIAEILGAKVFRHDVLYKLKDNPLYTYKDAIKEIAPKIKEVSLYAQSKGIKTCSENHGFIMQAPERVEELILAVGCENYGWLCDMGNFLCDDCEPSRSVAIASRYVFHAHAKDFLCKSGEFGKPEGFSITTNAGNYLRGTVIGHGVVPISKCVNILKKSGYDGWLSIEFEGPEETIGALENGYKNLKKIIG